MSRRGRGQAGVAPGRRSDPSYAEHANNTPQDNMYSHSVKYPPSMTASSQAVGMEASRFNPASSSIESLRPSMIAHRANPSSSSSLVEVGGIGDSVQRSSMVMVNDIVRQLNFAINENMRLRKAIEDNNHFFENGLEAIASTNTNGLPVKELEEEVQSLKIKVSESTNRFFEARVAVMGFKCRVIQLQGELDRARSEMGGSSMAEMKEQLTSAERDKKSFARVNHQLKQEVASLGDQKIKVDEENTRLIHERNELQYQVQEKDGQVQLLNSYLVQAQNEKQNQHEHTLLGQIQELTLKNRALDNSVASLKSSNDQLLNKNKKLEQTRDIMIQKLESSSPAPPPPNVAPTPKPRPSTIVDRERLEREIERLREENNRLQEDREKAEKQRSTVNVMFQDAQRKSQFLLEEKVQLEAARNSMREQLDLVQRRAESLEQERSDRQVQLEQLRKEAEALKVEMGVMGSERTSLNHQIAGLERHVREAQDEHMALSRSREEARQKVKKCQTEIADLEGRMLSSGSMGESLTDQKSLKPGMSMAHRLNDAIGKIRDLDLIKYSLEESLAEEKEDKLKQTRRLRSQVVSLEGELRKSKMQEEDIAQLMAKNSELQEQVYTLGQKLREMEITKESSMVHLRSELEQSRVTQDVEKRVMIQQVSDKDVMVTRLKEELQHSQDEMAKREKKPSNSDKLDNLQNSYSDLKAHCQQLDSGMKDKDNELEQFMAEHNHLLAENKDLKNTCEEYRNESESILRDYDTCAQRLTLAQDECSRLSGQHQHVCRELSHRTDRVDLLEKTRTELEENLNHMDQQMKIYQEDFDREKDAREAAMKVKNLAEDRIKRMEKELKECREQLNQHAAHRITYGDMPPRMELPPYPSSHSHMDPSYSSSSQSRMDPSSSSQSRMDPSSSSQSRMDPSSSHSRMDPSSSSQSRMDPSSSSHSRMDPSSSSHSRMDPSYPSSNSRMDPSYPSSSSHSGSSQPYKNLSGERNPTSERSEAPSWHSPSMTPPQNQQQQRRSGDQFSVPANNSNRPLPTITGVGPMRYSQPLRADGHSHYNSEAPHGAWTQLTPLQPLPANNSNMYQNTGARSQTMFSSRKDHQFPDHNDFGHASAALPPRGVSGRSGVSGGRAGVSVEGGPSNNSYHNNRDVLPSGLLDYDPDQHRQGNRLDTEPPPIPRREYAHPVEGRGNEAPPTMACPICKRSDFKTQSELVIHSAGCSSFRPAL